MRRTGWAETFALLRLADVPARDGHELELGDYDGRKTYSSIEDERRLTAIGHAVDRFFDRCDGTARNTDHSIRCWLRSQIPGRPYKAPFQLPWRLQTKKRSRGLWKGVIFFMARLYRLDDEIRESLLGVKFSEKQRRAIEQVWMSLEPESNGLSEGCQTPDSPCSDPQPAHNVPDYAERDPAKWMGRKRSSQTTSGQSNCQGGQPRVGEASKHIEEEDDPQPVSSDETGSEEDDEGYEASATSQSYVWSNADERGEGDVGLTPRGRSGKDRT